MPKFMYYRGDPCLVVGCPLPPVAQGYCNTHYQRLRRHGSPDDRWPDTCRIDGCHDHVHARGLCNAHYWQWLRRNGGAT